MIVRHVLGLLALGALAACYGTEDLIARASLEVLITGTEEGDRIKLTLDERESVLWVDAHAEEPLSLFADLPPGAHRGELELLRDEVRHCQDLSVETRTDRLERISIDLRMLPRCDFDEEDEDAGPASDAGSEDGSDGGPDDDESDGGPDDDSGDDDHEADAGPEPLEDAGPPLVTLHLARLEERVEPLSCSGDCEQQTRIEADGSLTVSGPDAIEGIVSPADFAALEGAVLSPEAERLFSGEDPSCPIASPSADERVELRRTYVVRVGDEDRAMNESVDVTECGGVAASLRARIALLRAIAEANEEGGD